MRPAPALAAAGLVAAALVLALVAAPAASELLKPSPAGVADLPTFRMVDSGAHGSELTLGVRADGAVFVGGWDHIARSTDDGRTWTKLAMALGPKVGPLNPPGLGFAADRVLVVDKDTGRVLVDDTTLGCTILTWSDDGGATWLRNPLACGGGITDHQKIAVGKRTALEDPTGQLYPNVIYACANGLSHANCGVSADGGLSFLPAAPHGVLCAFQGMPVADPAGTLYEPTSACGAMVRRTADNGRSWDEFEVPVRPSDDTPDVAVTADGTLYYFYTGEDWRPSLARSRDGGATWEGPWSVSVPGLFSAVFPVIVGGDAGRVALSFYGTTDAPSGWDGNPGKAPDAVRWHGYVAVVTDADAARPTIAPVQVTPPGDPLQYGCLSKLGSGCLVNIADYMDIDVGPDGRAYAVFVDGCLPGCDDVGESDSDNAVLAIQASGPTLKAAAATAAKAPRPGASAPAQPDLSGLLSLG